MHQDAQQKARDIPGIVAPPPLLYAGALLVGLALHRIRPQPIVPHRWAGPLGAVLVLAGLAGFMAVWSFVRAGTSPNPWRPSTHLVVTGPFRFSRNPMYLGFTLIYLGVSVWINALWPIVLLPLVLLVMQRGVIHREEAYLERRFGAAYREYRARVRRWL